MTTSLTSPMLVASHPCAAPKKEKSRRRPSPAAGKRHKQMDFPLTGPETSPPAPARTARHSPPTQRIKHPPSAVFLRSAWRLEFPCFTHRQKITQSVVNFTAYET